MRLPSLKLLAGGESGVTVLEALVGIGIMTIIGSSLVGSLYQMNNVASRGPAQLTVEADLRTSMQWLARDLRRAQTTDLDDGGAPVSCAAAAPDPCVTLDWTDQFGDNGTSYSASYALEGTDLKRTYDDGTTVTVHTVARNVAEVEVLLQDKLVQVTLTSSSSAWTDISNQFTHYFYLRPT